MSNPNISMRARRPRAVTGTFSTLMCLLGIAALTSACVQEDPETMGSNAGPTAGSPGGGNNGGGTGGSPTVPPSDEMPPPVDDNPPMDIPPLADQVLFEQTLYPALIDPGNFCVSCHAAIQIPTFASSDPVAAYNATVAQQKVDLDNPELSRIYVRPAVDRHNCGGDAQCDRIAAVFLAEIQTWAQQAIPPIPPAGEALLSAVTNFSAGAVTGSARVEDAQIALFTFSEGSGDVTVDSSGFGVPISLQIEGMEWVEGGLRNVSGKAQASLADSQKLFNAITQTGAYTIEAWVVPALETQEGPARIVSYSTSPTTRNFMLGQNTTYYRFRNRTADSNANGDPSLEALSPEVTTELTHVVATFDESVGRKLYIDGQLALEEDAPTTLAWSNDQIFVLANEVSNNRPWQGVLNMVSIHERALDAAEVLQNFQAGSGSFTILSFDVSSIVGGQSEIQMLAATLDDRGYLFAQPTLVSDVTPVRVKNIRIAVNDNVPIAAQAFRRVDETAMASGTQLSPLGAVIPIGLGPELDQFHLEFEVLGQRFGLTESIAPSAPPPPAADVVDAAVGVRTFSQLNDTMSALTGVSAANASVRERYAALRDSLPPTADILAFSSAQQIAIQQLATSYCGVVVDDPGACSSFFGSCAVNAGGKDEIATTLYERFVGQDIATQPAAAGFTSAIVGVLDDLGCTNGCTGETAQTALQASCAAALASGAVTLN